MLASPASALGRWEVHNRPAGVHPSQDASARSSARTPRNDALALGVRRARRHRRVPATANALGALDHALVQARRCGLGRLRGCLPLSLGLCLRFRLRLRPVLGNAVDRLDAARAEAAPQALKLPFRIVEILRRPHADQLPSEALEDHLVLQYTGELLGGDRAAAVTKDADTRAVRALHDDVDRVRADLVARRHAVALGVERAAHLALQVRLEQEAREIDRGLLARTRALDVLDQPQPQVSGLEVASQIERV